MNNEKITLPTQDELDFINRASANSTDRSNQRIAARQAREAAEAHRAHQMHCIWRIGWTAFAWIVAFGVSVILMHIGKIGLDKGAGTIACVSAMAGILVGRLISKMGE